MYFVLHDNTDASCFKREGMKLLQLADNAKTSTN